MINSYYFIDRALPVVFNINLDRLNMSHANSIITNKPNFPEIGIETRYINKIFKKMATTYARITKSI